jgi:hypothetical protein
LGETGETGDAHAGTATEASLGSPGQGGMKKNSIGKINSMRFIMDKSIIHLELRRNLPFSLP